MKPLVYLLSLVALVVCASCAKRERDPAYGEFAAHLAEMERGYCSTNMAVAEDALLKYRLWLLDRLQNDTTNSAGYDPSLSRAAERLFQLYELKGDTNQADRFNLEAVEVHGRVDRRHHQTPVAISKDEIRALLQRSEKGLVGWKASSAAVSR